MAAFGQLVRLSGLRTPRPVAMSGFRRMLTSKAEAEAAAHQAREAHFALLLNRARASLGQQQYQPARVVPPISEASSCWPMSPRNFRVYIWTRGILGVAFATSPLTAIFAKIEV
ncbi:hypothetical protein EJB05_00747 [Eragrostis curvula]|uniref:Uncharacterized protein n=1 Tax=Eragrostis curvula TaxID=38414 RepID=A0A5J9WQ67_9POAL|nr:hypothetical protein EJB05_00747 [Eragrostis curvula]